MKINPTVSVIYVNYNTSSLLIDSICSLEEHCTEIPFEIIIVDNASLAAEVDMLEKWIGEPTNRVQLIRAGLNLGFARANNLAAKQATGDFLFFLNPDTLLLNDAITVFYRFLSTAGERVAACGGKLLRTDGEDNDAYGNFPGLMQELCSVGVGISSLLGKHHRKRIAIAAPAGEEIEKVSYIVGADIFIKAECFRQVSGFDEHYFMYYEETDLFRRLEKEGYESYVLPAARIVHFEGAALGSPKTFNHRKFEMLLESKLYYYNKWFGGLSLFLVKWITLFQILVQFVKGRMGRELGTLLKIYRRKAWA